MKSPKKFPKDWKEQIQKSGKLFEHEIALFVQKHGFGYVVPNDAFLDIESGESRELDVFAIAGEKIGRKWNFLFPILLVAIKRMSLVCFAREEFMTRYTLGDIHISGVPKTIYLKGKELDLSEYINLEKTHHFYKYKKVSSQFWTPFAKDKEERGDYFYKKLILPLIKSVISQVREHEKGWYFDPEGEPINLQIYYPLIVVENLWECTLTKKGPRYKRIPRIGFISKYSSEKISGTYLIDVCDKEGLRELLRLINSEINVITATMRKKIKVIESSALAEARKKVDESRE